MKIRIPVPNAGGYVLEFDSDAIVQIETPREMVQSPDGLGHMEFSGRNSLILSFATLDDAPKWVEPHVPDMDDPGTYVTMTQAEFDEWSKRHGAKWAEPDLAAGVPDAG